VQYFSQAGAEALRMLVGLDREVYAAAALSLWISTLAICLACPIGVSIGAAVGRGGRRGWRRLVLAVLSALMALPTVLIGLVLYALLSRRGLLGPLGLLYTPWAMVVGQTVLALPIIAALTAAAVAGADERIEKTALTLGAPRLRRMQTVVSEVRLAVLAAVVAAFGRVIGEVGVSMMLGGNIRFYTRNLTAAIALDTARGDFARGIALGVILMVLALGTNLAVQGLRWETRAWRRFMNFAK